MPGPWPAFRRACANSAAPAALPLPQVVTAQSIKAAQAQTQTQLGAAAAAGDLGASVALAAGYPALGGAAQQNSLVRAQRPPCCLLLPFLLAAATLLHSQRRSRPFAPVHVG